MTDMPLPDQNRRESDVWLQELLRRQGLLDVKVDGILQSQSSLATSVAVSIAERTSLHDQLQEVKQIVTASANHSHPGILSEVEKVSKTLYGRDGTGGIVLQVQRLWWVQLALVGLFTIIGAPLIVTFLGFILVEIATGHIKITP